MNVPVSPGLPVVDLSQNAAHVADAIGRACHDFGFFYVVGHGVDEKRAAALEAMARRFFAQDLDHKMEIRMEKAGRAIRGYFPVGGELTSGVPDVKEGLYFGTEHPDDHPRVLAGAPLHGKNMFPDEVFRVAVSSWLDDMTRLGHRLLAGIAQSLGLPASYFQDNHTADPTVLFRIFHYPPPPPDAGESTWGVGEHTDYGWLTILWQDTCGGLFVKSRGAWIEAPPLPGSFVCNIGDMLDRTTGGRYRSTPHRVRNASGRARLSMPFFFDPGWDSPVAPLELGAPPPDDAAERWDKANVHAFRGTYGEYLRAKVGKVFPHLAP